MAKFKRYKMKLRDTASGTMQDIEMLGNAPDNVINSWMNTNGQSKVDTWMGSNADPIVDDWLDENAAGEIAELWDALGDFYYTQTKTSRLMDIDIPVSQGDIIYFKPLVWTGDSFSSIGLIGYNGSTYRTLGSVFNVGDETFSEADAAYQSLRVAVGTASAPSTVQTLTFILVKLDSNTFSEDVYENKYDIANIEKEITEIGENLGVFAGKYHGQFPSSATSVNTLITLKPNTTYLIRFYYPRTGQINVYGYGNLDNFKTVWSCDRETYFTNDSTPRYLMIYNSDGVADIADVSVFEVGAVRAKAEDVPQVYTVSKTYKHAQYTSLTQCLLDLKDDESPKIIEILEGDYDIYQEYVDANIPVYTGDNPATEYFPYCVWVPSNTHIIGKGIVRLKWMPTKENNPEITWKQCYAVSPVNCAGTMTLENIEIHCKNGRYCIHNDPLGKGEYVGAVHKYINVRCYKYEPEEDTTTSPGETHIYGTHHVLGFGIDRSMHHIYENCKFVNYDSSGPAFYGHDRGVVNGVTLTETMSSEMTFNNCIFKAIPSECIRFQNGSSTAPHIRVLFSNCYFSGSVKSIGSSGSTVYRNKFDMAFLGCGESVDVYIQDPNNLYTPEGYNTTLNIT